VTSNAEPRQESCETTHGGKLSLADAVAVHDDPVWLEPARRLVEHHEVLLHHGRQLLDHLDSVGLDPDGGRVARRMSILAS
jgi:hypothetical protein